MDYKTTLNLPQTPFPMKADLLANQSRLLRRWQTQSIYRSILEDRRDAEPYVIHDGPPYPSGEVHVGIGMNKVLKDVVSKYQCMNDRRVRFVPGWDCHGLPIELQALRELKAGDSPPSVRDVRQHCEKRVLDFIGRQRSLFEALGIFADWDRPYMTMAPTYEAATLTMLLDMLERGYLRQELRPLAWCCACDSGLADAEIEYRTVSGRSLWLRVRAGDEVARQMAADDGQIASLMLWTTTPWSLPGNVAAALHPQLEYGIFGYRDGDEERADLLLPSRASEVFAALGVEQYRQIGTVAGERLVGLEVEHPIFDRRVPVVAADYVSDDFGSGVVHIAPGHGVEDFAIASQNGLEVVSPIDGCGRFTEEAGGLAGLALPEAEDTIIDLLRSRGTLAALGTQAHDYPHCQRCQGPAITRATKQWFVDLDHRENGEERTLRERALLEIEVTQWLPAESRQRFHSTIETRPNWCISRQRVWGTPLPALSCRSCGEDFLSPEVVGRVRDVVAEHGANAWFDRELHDFLPEGLECPACKGRDFEKGSDVLDVWFESGSSWLPVLVADYRGGFPADLYLEGSDQHRGWFQVSLLTSLVARGQAPFRSVLTHGFVLNRDRERMSRDHGDLTTLEAAIAEVPADLIRLFFMSVDTSADIPLTAESFRSVEGFYRNLRNAFRFALANLGDYEPQEHAVHLADLEPLDLWALGRFHRLVSKVDTEYRAFRFHAALLRIHEYCNEELSRKYFDMLKDRLYCEAPSAAARRSAQTALHSILVGLVKTLAPILPYTCEEVWDLTPGRGDCASVHLSRWPRTDEALLSTTASRAVGETFGDFEILRAAVKQALEQLREVGTIGSDQDATVRIHVPQGLEAFLGPAGPVDLRDFLRVSEVVEVASSEGLEPVTGLEGASVGVEPCPHPRCVRCRLLDSTCGEDDGHPDLCGRCAEVVRSLDQVHHSPPASAKTIDHEIRPADLARFMRESDLRRVALLNEDGVCRAWALNPPSQEVRVLEALQPLADYINESPDFRDHAAVLLGLGEHTHVLFGIGIHHLNYGTPLGGTREYAYARVGDMLDNLLRLSWGMSVKNAIAELPHAGGKSIIDTCGWDLKIHRELRREIYRDFGQFTASLFGRYICAEDVGNTTADTREMLASCRHVMCLSQGVGGSGNPSRFTSLAAWSAAKAGWKFLTGETSFAGLTVALQGTGNVGRNFVSILVEADPDLGRLLVADRDPEQIQTIRNILLKRGLDGILEVVSSKDPRANDRSYVEREEELGRDYILYAPCDLLVPAAVGNVIDPGNVADLACRLILPIANNIYSDNDAVARALHDRGIVDVVENNVNWGGALAAASETLGYDESNVAAACIEAFDKTLALLNRARDEGRPPWELIKEVAQERVFEGVHPAVAAARSYSFIGDISKDFVDWVKDRWLRNVVDVPRDRFPQFAVQSARRSIH